MGSSQSQSQQKNPNGIRRMKEKGIKIENPKYLQIEIKKEKAYKLICNKENFYHLLKILNDAHEVTEYYAELLLRETLPVALPFYKNYSKDTESYFNETRKLKWVDINMSYHDFYNKLAFLNYMYEATINNGVIRRSILLSVFDESYKIQKHLIEDVYKYCGNGFK